MPVPDTNAYQVLMSWNELAFNMFCQYLELLARYFDDQARLEQASCTNSH